MTLRTSNKTISKNVSFLYIRMIIVLFIGLYTSRVILEALGVVDFGIYNVVGGVVGLLSFLNSALSGATSRFLTFELGRGNIERVRSFFQASFTLHSLLILLLILLFETIGLWFLNTKLNIPEDRLQVANVVYQLSILACCFQIFLIPFNSLIISYERMNIFALISIIDAVLKLIISFAIVYSTIDRLIFYSGLLLGVTVFDAVLYIGYCKYKFPDFKYKFTKERAIIKPLLTYSGWDLFGNFSVVVRSQGIVILLNVFFGAVVNAAAAISNQVMSAIMGFAENFLMAVRPQIVKQYAHGSVESFNNLVIKTSKYSFLLLFIVSFPVFCEAKFILSLWLVNVPDYAVVFCQLSIINNWVSIIYRPIVISIGATGSNKRISIINGCIYLLVLPLSFIILKVGGSPIVPFFLNIILLTIGNTIFSLQTIRVKIPTFKIRLFIVKALIPSVCVALLSCIAPLITNNILGKDFYGLIISLLSIFWWECFIIYFIALDTNEKGLLGMYVKLISKRILHSQIRN